MKVVEHPSTNINPVGDVRYFKVVSCIFLYNTSPSSLFGEVNIKAIVTVSQFVRDCVK